MKKIKILYKYFTDYIPKRIFVSFLKFKVLSIEDTLTLLIQKKASIIRFGDGEINLFSGSDIYFQSYTKKINDDFLRITKNVCDNVIIAIPDTLCTMKNAKLYSRWHWVSHINEKKYFYKLLFDNKHIYGNAFFSRPYPRYTNYNKSSLFFNKLNQLWDGKNILIVEGEFTRNGYKNDLFRNSLNVQRIICPSENAYYHIPEIQKKIIEVFNHDIILFSLGPASKILIYELSLLNYICIDIGHIDTSYEWFLRKDTRKKTSFDYKHTADKKDYEINKVFDEEYLNSIIAHIK